VLLVILIFVMSITSAQVLKVDKSIELPVSANALKKDNQRAEAGLDAVIHGCPHFARRTRLHQKTSCPCSL